MMWRESPSSGPNKVLKAGTLDDGEKIISSAIIDTEAYTRSRIDWVQPIVGASQRAE
jgi:hypothetical protein